MRLAKPSYGTSKRLLWFSTITGHAFILLCAIGALYGSAEAVSFGAVVVPSTYAFIAALLGIHRNFGSEDFRASNLPRDQPGGEP